MSTLLLSGWAQPTDALKGIADDAVIFDYSDFKTPDEALRKLKNIPHTNIISWSLGGALAMHGIASGALNPKHITLIAAPYQFVQTPDYKHAMDTLTYERFHNNYASNPARTKERFLSLIAKGESDEKRIIRALNHHAYVENTSRWLPWLQWMANHSFNSTSLKNAPPTLVIHGENDAVVSTNQTQSWAEKLPNASISMWQSVGHAPHISDPKRLRDEIAAHRKASGT